MKKELKDYLPFYLGCDYQDQFGGLGNINEHTFSVMFDAAKRNVPFKLILRPLSDMNDSEINDIVSIMLGREATCGRIWRSEDKDFIIADFKQEKPLPPYNEKYKSMSMGVYIKSDFQVDYKWNYYTEKNCEGSCGTTDEPLHNHNEITRYMLSKHFDVFSLIEAGLAIDKTKL